MSTTDKHQASENDPVEAGGAVDPARSSTHTSQEGLEIFLRGRGLEGRLDRYLKSERKNLYIRTKLGDDGAKELAAALRKNSTLTHLHLENNKIGDEGAVAVGEALR
eukprot:CAMPEP_0194276234 /NCGR_PEP_ID=MMETSP0169-20130528/8876_1 /TAXON_ID=218684 /ORGANISM="Corethron pennatum, Strain L29A3" /LENGTH=106 /DNA_ID=CAMNT_0039019901 /DNA_START=127 /DNA_END=443 /DNA_ORIENTATION=-